MFNSFQLQSEYCPNYIILIPSLSCFNRSVVSIIPLLTGVSSKCFHSVKFMFYSFSFLPECCPKFCHSCSLAISLYRCGHMLSVGEALISCLSSRNVPCSSLLTVCLQSRSPPLYSFFRFVQPLKVHWFHSFVKEATCFTCSSSVSPRCHPRSRDEILL